MGPLLKPGYSTVLLSYCKSRSMSLCACKWNKQKSLLRQKYLTKMLLGDAVMLFHRKMRHYKNIGHWPIPILLSIIIEKGQCINKLLFRSRHVPLQIKVRSFVTIAKRVTSRVGSVNVTVDPMKATPGTKWTQLSPERGLFLRFGRNVSKHSLGAHKTSNQFHSYCSENRLWVRVTT